MTINWVAPYANGATIDAYHIEIQDYNSLWQQDAACDGSGASSEQIIAMQSCIVPMANLRVNLGLQFDALVYVRVSASNMMGQGAWSLANSDGETIRIEPVKMNQIQKGPASTENSLDLFWVGLTETADIGNSAILSYEVYWDANSGNLNLLLHDSLVLTN